jgi:hypothetical protein
MFWKGDDEGYVRLKVEYLRRVIPDRAERSVRESLIRAGVLEEDPRYERGVRSRGYRLGPDYRAPFTRVECADAAVAARVRRLDRARRRATPLLDVHRHLLAWYRRLEIDCARAMEIASRLEHREIHEGHIEFSRCAQGRVHTVVTRLAKELRAALHFGGQPLWNVDVACSQPLILAQVIREHQAKIGWRTNGDTGGGGAATNTMSNAEPPPLQVVENGLLTANDGAMTDDQRLYVGLCEEGGIYEYVQEIAGRRDVARQDFKGHFFCQVFFASNDLVTPLTRRFAEHFPNVISIIRDEKRTDYGGLARRMQTVESALMIGGVCRVLMERHPEIPVITIHDSILTTFEHVPTVQTLMANEFRRIGLRPKLKTEPCDPMSNGN